MKVWANGGGSNGRIVEFDTTGEYEPTTIYPRVLDIPERGNHALIRDMVRNIGSYSLSANNTLLLNGQPVTLATPNQDDSDSRAMPAIMAKLEAEQNLTNTELRIALRTLIREALPKRYGGRGKDRNAAANPKLTNK